MTYQFICTLLLLIATASSIYASDDRSYVVLVKGKDGSVICGGALYNNRTVITAATCLTFYDVDQLVVGIVSSGQDINIDNNGHTFNIAFDPATQENDVAILRLAEPVNATYVKLPSKQPVTGSTGVLTIWSANKTLVDISETIITADDCVSGKYNYEDGDLFDSMFCGLSKDQACGAIAGSPLVSEGELVGLASWGYGCANKANPAVYTNIYEEKSWITSTVESW
ncbi:trypsin theta-like [Rhagoletis pomonella]|uniref:trypsin theta-like n=1 Tax=Rhagoletis pomonella TaxID=28610 RepID=UPI00177B420C|nr:trypsin theta-like [Rhagoletis pomonella]